MRRNPERYTPIFLTVAKLANNRKHFDFDELSKFASNRAEFLGLMNKLNDIDPSHFWQKYQQYQQKQEQYSKQEVLRQQILKDN